MQAALSSPSVYYAEKAVRLRGIYLCHYPVPCGAIVTSYVLNCVIKHGNDGVQYPFCF